MDIAALKNKRRNIERDIRDVIVVLTPSCNKHCIYCYEESLWKGIDVVVNVDKIVEQIKRYNVDKVTLLGGESFNSDYLFDILESLSWIKSVDIFTDAMPNDKHYTVLKNFGNVVLRMSLDPTWKTRFDSRDDWLRACDWVLFLISEFGNDRICIEPVLTKFGMDWNVLRERIGNDINLYLKPVAEVKANFDILNYEDFDLLVKNEFRRYRSGNKAVKQVEKYIAQVKNVFSGGVATRCSCFVRRITVDWEGNEAFCDAYRLSKLGQYDVEAGFEKWIDYSSKCYTCNFVEFCGGSCILLENPNDFYCEFQKIFLKYAIEFVLNSEKEGSKYVGYCKR
jgi:molybdenum cofactor biosynthesis enzyme MoaA